jgi:hypothetical protein
VQTEQLSVHHPRVEYLITFLKSANCCHIRRAIVSDEKIRPQGQRALEKPAFLPILLAHWPINHQAGLP